MPLRYPINRRLLVALLIVLLAGCAAPQPAAPAATATTAPTAAPPTAAIPPTATPTHMPKPTASPTPLPDLPEGPFTWKGGQRPLLLIHYMPWYQAPPTNPEWGWHWTMNHFAPMRNEDGTWKDFASHYQPLTGLYDSRDEALLEYQVQLMKLSGIDGVIVDWYGMEVFWDYGLLNDATGRLFEIIKKAGLKFAICYEDQTIKHMVENGHIKEADAAAHGQKVMAYMQENWFGDEAYLKVDGRPVLLIFGPQYFKDGKTWTTLFSGLPAQPLFITLDNPLPPTSKAAYPWPPMWASKGGVLSHDTLLSYLVDFYDKAENYPYLVGGAFPGFHDIYKEAGVSEGYGYLDALDGKTFRFTLQQALDHTPDAIQLITWNDYGEGTNIEPALEYEYRYLEMVLEARKATDPGFAGTNENLRLPFQLYRLRLKAQKEQDAPTLESLQKASLALLQGDVKTAQGILAGMK